MVTRGIFVGLFMLSVGCGEAAQDAGAPEVAATAQSLASVHAQDALDWANDWMREVELQPANLSENVYDGDPTALDRMVGTTKARNRTVCGTFVTQLIQKSLGFTSSDFTKSFNKAMDSCAVKDAAGKNLGTNSPNAAQYRYKIANCASTGTITFTARSTITAIEAGDVLAVSYPERTDISGHVMVVREKPVADTTLLAGPAGSTAYAVEIIDSTSTPHGTSTTYPDWRGGDTGEGLGHGTFVLYANTLSGAIVASRWSPTDPNLFTTAAHPLAVGGQN